MNWKTLRGTLAIALVALIASACSVSRQAVNSATSSTVQDSRDSVRVEQVMVAVHDTIVETTTIIVRENEQGDTLRLSKVTERDRIRDRAEIREQHERVVVQHDTVFVAVRDSTSVESHTESTASTESWPSALARALKWLFWIIVAVTVLVAALKIGRKFI